MLLGIEGFFLSDQGLDCNWTHQDGGKGYKGVRKVLDWAGLPIPAPLLGSSLGSQVTFSSYRFPTASSAFLGTFLGTFLGKRTFLGTILGALKSARTFFGTFLST